MIPRQKGTGKIDYRFHRWENRPWKNRLQDFTFGKSTVEKSTTGFYLWKSTVEKSTTGFTGGKIDRGKIDYRFYLWKSTVEKSTTGFYLWKIDRGKIDYRITWKIDYRFTWKIDRGKIDYRILPLEIDRGENRRWKNRLQVSPVGKSTTDFGPVQFVAPKVCI